MENPRPSTTDDADAPWRQVMPTPGEITRWRMGVSILLRIASLAIAMFALWPLLSWIVQGIRDDDLLMMEYYVGYLIWAVILLAMAAWLGLGARRLAKRLVPIPERPLCPKCGFDVSGLRDSTCPECALHFQPRAASAGAGPSYTLWHAAAILVVRAVALLLFGFAISGALSWIVALVVYDLAPAADQTLAVLSVLLQLTPGPVLWAIAPWLARRALAGATAWQ